MLLCVRWGCAGLLTFLLVGCGDSTGTIPVTGTVTLDDKPLPDALVTFHPEGDTAGLGGTARTDAEGKYTLTPAKGSGGLPAGDYVVVVNRFLQPDGSALPPDVPPMESKARESLPSNYTSRKSSTLKAKVSKEKPTYDFALKSAKK